MFDKTILSPLQSVTLPGQSNHSHAISLLREDLIHPEISGNKWRKLKYNFLKAMVAHILTT